MHVIIRYYKCVCILYYAFIPVKTIQDPCFSKVTRVLHGTLPREWLKHCCDLLWQQGPIGARPRPACPRHDDFTYLMTNDGCLQ